MTELHELMHEIANPKGSEVEAIDLSNIISGRRTRGKKIDFKVCLSVLLSFRIFVSKIVLFHDCLDADD